MYQNYCESAKKVIQNYCGKREPQMRSLLEKTINEIYVAIFPNSTIHLSLNSEYALSITIDGKPVSKAFLASESQRAIIVFSFITGVVELAGRTIQTEENDLDIDENVETYPLVFDAPTSTFDKESTVAFSNILTNIAEQVIIFVNDKDGELILKDMNKYLGKKYIINKIDDFNSTVKGEE